MIVLAKSCVGGGALANYILDKKKGYELDRNLLCSDSSKGIIEEMRIVQDLNQTSVNKTFSIVLSPDIADGKKLTDNDLKEITQEYLTKIGIDPSAQQYIAFIHTEKEHKHIHIIANRVQLNGKLISDHYIGKRSHWIVHDIAKSRGLISARDKMNEKSRNAEQQNDYKKTIKNEIFTIHKDVISNCNKTFTEYIIEMKTRGIIVKPVINKQKQVQGFRVLSSKYKKEFKSSEIHRSMSIGNLMKLGFKNDLDFKTSKRTINFTKAQYIVKSIAYDAKKLLKSQNTEQFLQNIFSKTKLTLQEYKDMLDFKENVVPMLKLAEKINDEFEQQKKNDMSKRLIEENEL